MKRNANLLPLVGILIVVSMLTGCSASGPVFSRLPEIAPGKAMLVVFWEKGYNPFLRTVYIDDEKVGSLRYNGYSIIQTTPGPHDICLEHRPLLRCFGLEDRATVDLSAGEAVFVEYNAYPDRNKLRFDKYIHPESALHTLSSGLRLSE